MTPTATTQRIELIDDLRGIAVLLMAIFHFCYDLSVFGFMEFAMDGGFFSWFRYLIVTLFFTSVGAGLYLAHTPFMRWRAFWVRELKLVAGAAIITVSTVLMYPNAWVYFGVLHFIAVASLLALGFIRFPRVALIVGVLCFLLYNMTDWFNLHQLYLLLAQPLHLPPGTQDLTRLIPWLGMVLIGIYAGHRRFWQLPPLTLGPVTPVIRFFSQHSLLIYLLHQPPLFALAWGLDQLLH